MAVAETGNHFRLSCSRRKKAGKKGLRPSGDAARYRALDLGRFQKPLGTAAWRGGRVVECTALEMRRAWKGTVGSNPTLSATTLD